MPKWSKDEVQEATGGSLPEGLATVKVTSMEETESQAGKFALKVETRVTDFKIGGKSQPQYKNMPFRFTFYIGTDSDLGAEKKETWASSFAAKRYKAFLKAARIPIVGNTEEECETAAGAELMIQVKTRKYTDASGNERTGSEADSFYAIGGDAGAEHSVANGLDNTVKRVAPAVAKKAVEAYVEDDE